MTKKRKASAKAAGQADEEEAFSRTNSKLNITSYEDVADSEDEFHLQREKILLEEGPARKRQRKLDDDAAEFELSDEEVYAGPDEDDELEADDYDDEIGDDDEQDDDPDNAAARKYLERHNQSKRLGSEEDQEEEEEEEEEDEDAKGWGTSKRDYYNADVIETEVDALEEEQEALRLQKKQLAGMTAADYGFNEADWLDNGTGEEEHETTGGGVRREVLPQLELSPDMPSEEKEKILSARYPEFGPLADEFVSLQKIAEEMRVTASSTGVMYQKRAGRPHNSGTGTLAPQKPLKSVQEIALNGYLGALSMYFAILTSATTKDGDHKQAIPPLVLREHPIMDNLLRHRTLWAKVRDLQLSAYGPLNDEEEEPADEDMPIEQSSKMASGTSMPLNANGAAKQPKKKRRKKSKAEKAALAVEATKREEQAKNLRQIDEDFAKLQEPLKDNGTLTADLAQDKSTADFGDSDFGEEETLDPHEAAEKAKRRKSLKFYTSQIAQKANRREAAQGGDDDLPYRERIKDRVARLNTEAEVRGKNKRDVGASGLDGDSDDEDRRQAADVRETADDGDKDYYQIIASKTSAKKASKAARSAVQKEAALRGARVHEVEEVGPDGKRAITYAIQKNKGLTPHRKKDVRNPRVKKRKKFEEKKKKLGSMRPVYKGGEGRGGYGGELTGIKKGLVRSTKL